MRRFKSPWLVGLIAVALLLCVFPARAQETPPEQPPAQPPQQPAEPTPPAAPQDIVLFSWDGLSRAVVWELLAKQKLPNLAALIREGSLQEIDIVMHVTVTKPGHATMLTGLDPETTGVISNSDYRPIPEGYTIFERVQKHFGGKEAIRTFMLTSKLAHVGGRGPDEIGEGAKKVKPEPKAPAGADDSPDVEVKGEPFFLTKKSLDVFDSSQREASETGPLCLKYLAQFKEPRFLAFLHFSDPDHAGHKHGRDSQEYRDAAIACDVWLGKVVEWLKQEKLYDKTLVYVVADHGFDEHASSHGNAPDSWLATNDKEVTHGGMLADVPATILARFGLNVDELEPGLIGKPLTGAAETTATESGKGKLSEEEAQKKAEEQIKANDKDGDGKLSAEEFPTEFARGFDRVDADGDGFVSTEELSKALVRQSKRKRR